jgi:hypothetical protein
MHITAQLHIVSRTSRLDHPKPDKNSFFSGEEACKAKEKKSQNDADRAHGRKLKETLREIDRNYCAWSTCDPGLIYLAAVNNR